MNKKRLTDDKIQEVDKLKELFLDKYSFDITHFIIHMLRIKKPGISRVNLLKYNLS